MKNQKSVAKKQQQERKPVKKNTWYRKFRAWVLRLEHRQMHDTPQILVRDNDTHVCQHCGTEYTGAYCPKCSMPARWHRFNWKLLFLNFLDIWGLGNRPMFRTIRDLFWRPGYMIRDYLRGHHLSYFPPFKMLAVWTLLLVFSLWLLKSVVGVDPDASKSLIEGLISGLDGKVSTTTAFLVEQLKTVNDYLNDHMLYKIILLNILVVLAVKSTFRKVSDYNLVETFFSQIYINCQFNILAVLTILLTWRYPSSNTFLPYMEGFIPVPLLLMYDFHQLYGVTWKRALWKTIVVAFKLMILYLIVALVIMGVLLLVEHFTNPSSELLNIDI